MTLCCRFRNPFGAYVYNSLESDDSIVTDADAIANTVSLSVGIVR